MKPELRAILDTIGYTRALQSNRSLFFWAWEPNDRGSRFFKDKTEAVEDLTALKNLSEALNAMSSNSLKLLNDHSRHSDDWDQDREPLIDVIFAVGDLLSMFEIEKERYWDGRGASRRIAGEDIAKHMAEIFVLGLGQMPGSGAIENGNPSGLFPNAVSDVFRCIGISDNFRRPCTAAVAWLKADDRREFNRLMQMRQTKGRAISLFSGAERK